MHKHHFPGTWFAIVRVDSELVWLAWGWRRPLVVPVRLNDDRWYESKAQARDLG